MDSLSVMRFTITTKILLNICSRNLMEIHTAQYTALFFSSCKKILLMMICPKIGALDGKYWFSHEIVYLATHANKSNFNPGTHSHIYLLLLCFAFTTCTFSKIDTTYFLFIFPFIIFGCWILFIFVFFFCRSCSHAYVINVHPITRFFCFVLFYFIFSSYSITSEPIFEQTFAFTKQNVVFLFFFYTYAIERKFFFFRKHAKSESNNIFSTYLHDTNWELLIDHFISSIHHWFYC